MKRKIFLKLTTLAEAQKIWFTKLAQSPLKKESIPLSKAYKRVLAKAAVARLSSPAFHGAAMDGVAVKAEDTFGATDFKPKTLEIGKTAFWINTGHPLPFDTNAVIMIEEVQKESEEKIIIEKAVFPWQHVRRLGEDMVATEILLPPFSVIGAYEIGALAAAGINKPLVFSKPKVAILPTGSELLALDDLTDELINSGKALPEFNSLILAALVKDAGGEAEVLPIVADDPDLIRKALLKACQGPYDLIVINAGSSAGSKDFTPDIVAELGELWVHGVNIMPGKPTVLGMINGKPVLGAPGYPISAIISFEQFAQPLLARWQGRFMESSVKVLASPYQSLPSKTGMEEFIRVKLGRVGENLIAVPLPRGAGTVTSLSRADGILRVPANSEGVLVGKETFVSLIHSAEHIEGSLLAVGSHDNTLDLLDSLLKENFPKFSLTSASVGSLGGLMALKEGRAHLSGCHLLDSKTGLYNQQAILDNLSGLSVKLVRLADREQGLIVPKGNPENIKSLKDFIIRPELSFINRQRGSGTRLLLDWELKKAGFDPRTVNGYQNEEYTHMNVAVAVLSARASAGLGVKAAAIALNLDFIKIGVEEYDLVIPLKYWQDPRVIALLEVLNSQEFKQEAVKLGGYDTSKSGELIWES